MSNINALLTSFCLKRRFHWLSNSFIQYRDTMIAILYFITYCEIEFVLKFHDVVDVLITNVLCNNDVNNNVT